MTTPAPKPRSNFNNWISASGGVLALGALFSFALLVWMDFTGDHKNPYLGIFTYDDSSDTFRFDASQLKPEPQSPVESQP